MPKININCKCNKSKTKVSINRESRYLRTINKASNKNTRIIKKNINTFNLFIHYFRRRYDIDSHKVKQERFIKFLYIIIIFLAFVIFWEYYNSDDNG